MSLNSCRLPKDYHDGKVFISASDDRTIPFLALMTLAVASGRGDMIIEPCAQLYKECSDMAFVNAVYGMHTKAKALIAFVSKTLRTDPRELTAYIIFNADDGDAKYEKVTMDIPQDKFFVLVSTNDVCVIVANAKDVSITSTAKESKSDNLHQILQKHSGYHTYNEQSSPVTTFAEMLDRETIELGNVSIYAYLSQNYQAVQDLHIPIDKPIGEELCRYLNARIVASLSDEFHCNFGEKPCCWVCSSEDAVMHYYIKPFEGMPSDICELQFRGEMVPVCDLGAQGCLIVADEVCAKVHTTSEESTKTSVFSRDDKDSYTLTGIPVYEDGLALAVTARDFYSRCHRRPLDADKSKTVENLYLVRDIPDVPLWQRCMNSRFLYKITLDSFGVQRIEVTDIPVVRL